jgi:hypothetical protein
MLPFEVYVNKRLSATFQNWIDAEAYALNMGQALIIDCDGNAAYHFDNGKITAERLFAESE